MDKAIILRPFHVCQHMYAWRVEDLVLHLIEGSRPYCWGLYEPSHMTFYRRGALIVVCLTVCCVFLTICGRGHHIRMASTVAENLCLGLVYGLKCGGIS